LSYPISGCKITGNYTRKYVYYPKLFPSWKIVKEQTYVLPVYQCMLASEIFKRERQMLPSLRQNVLLHGLFVSMRVLWRWSGRLWVTQNSCEP